MIIVHRDSRSFKLDSINFKLKDEATIYISFFTLKHDPLNVPPKMERYTVDIV
jgi:hypothetical protein